MEVSASTVFDSALRDMYGGNYLVSVLLTSPVPLRSSPESVRLSIFRTMPRVHARIAMRLVTQWLALMASNAAVPKVALPSLLAEQYVAHLVGTLPLLLVHILSVWTLRLKERAACDDAQVAVDGVRANLDVLAQWLQTKGLFVKYCHTSTSWDQFAGDLLMAGDALLHGSGVMGPLFLEAYGLVLRAARCSVALDPQLWTVAVQCQSEVAPLLELLRFCNANQNAIVTSGASLQHLSWNLEETMEMVSSSFSAWVCAATIGDHLLDRTILYAELCESKALRPSLPAVQKQAQPGLYRIYPALCPVHPCISGSEDVVLVLGGISSSPQRHEDSDAETADEGLMLFNAASNTVSAVRLETSLPHYVQHTMTTFDGKHFFVLGTVMQPVVQTTSYCIQLQGAEGGGLSARVTGISVTALHHGGSADDSSGDLTVYGHTAVPLRVASRQPKDEFVVAFGGVRRDGQTTNAVYALDVRSRKWEIVADATAADSALCSTGRGASSVPAPRLYHVACSDVDAGVMYMFGGAPDAKTTSADDVVFADFWAYKLEYRRWQQIPPRGDAPTKRGSASMTFVGRYVILLGGFNGAVSLTDAYRYNTVCGFWQEVDCKPKGPLGDLRGASLSWGGGSCLLCDRRRIAVLGGYVNDAQSKPFGTCEKVVVVSVPTTSLKDAAANWALRHIPNVTTEPMR